MIIFGFRVKVAILAMLTYVCDHCGVTAAHRVVKRTRWFTLFFIPLIPVSTGYYDTCIHCGRNLQLTKQQVDSVSGTSRAAPAA